MPLDHAGSEGQQRILAIAENLEQSLSRIDAIAGYGEDTRKLTEQNEKLVKRARRNNRILGVSIILDVILTVVLVVLGFTSVNNTNAIHHNQIAACNISNKTRADQITLWKGLIAESTHGQKHISNQQRHTDKIFLTFVEHTFKPLDCAKIYSTSNK